MTAKILTARDTGKAFHIEIHLDTTKMLADGVTPDSRYVGRWDFGNSVPLDANGLPIKGPDGVTPMTLAQYKAQVASEVKLLAADLLQRINGTGAGAALPIEGQTF